MILHR